MHAFRLCVRDLIYLIAMWVGLYIVVVLCAAACDNIIISLARVLHVGPVMHKKCTGCTFNTLSKSKRQSCAVLRMCKATSAAKTLFVRNNYKLAVKT